MILDSHCHWLPQQIIQNAHFYSKAWGDIEAQVKMMSDFGIDKCVLSYPTSDAHLKLGGSQQVAKIFNDNVGDILKSFSDKFIGAAILPVGDSNSMLEELKRAKNDLGFKAISLASSYNGVYLDDNQFLPIYEYAQKNNLPIFVHSQIVNPIGFERVQDPLLTPVIEYIFDTTICVGKLLMADIFKNYPNLKFVFAYFGGITCHLANRFDSTYAMLRGINFVKDLEAKPSDYLKNIYVDTSGDTVKSNFDSALQLVGSEHILWGSDWPAKKDPRFSIQAISDLNISEEDKKNILGGNLKRILE